MKKMKLEVSKSDKLILEKMRERLADIEIENDGELSRIKGGCGEQCQVTCSWWCEDQCQESCYMTTMPVGSFAIGPRCAHRPMGDIGVPLQ